MFKFQQHALSAEEFAMKDLEMVHQYDYLFTQMHWHKDWLEQVKGHTEGCVHQINVDKMVESLGLMFNDKTKDQSTVAAFRELAKKACPCDRWSESKCFAYFHEYWNWHDTTYRITLNPDGTWTNWDQLVMSRDTHSDCSNFGVYWVVGDRVDFEGFRKGASSGWDYSEAFNAKVMPVSFYMTINEEGMLVVPDKGQVVNMVPDEGFPCTLK
jgi:hypothetical protein